MRFALRWQSDLHGKLIYGFNVSVDGYIADAQGNIDWTIRAKNCTSTGTTSSGRPPCRSTGGGSTN